MTKLNHQRDDLRRIDDAKKTKELASRPPNVLSSKQETHGFLNEQDSMGSALSELGSKPFELMVQIAACFEHAFVHNDLHALKKFLIDTPSPNERSLLLRIFNGLLNSHRFVLSHPSIKLEKNGRIEWRAIGVEALWQNLQLYRSSNGAKIPLSDTFEEKCKKMSLKS